MRMSTVERAIVALFFSLPLACGAQEATPGAVQTGGAAAQSAQADSPQAEAAQARAREIVQRADAIRFPQDGFQVDVAVTSTTDGEEQEARRYRVYSKGNENTIVQTIAPAVDRGQNMLMRGRDLWIFMPSVSQPVRLSLSQRLTGQVANGDLARANFAGDYTPTLLRTETIGGAPHHVLELVASQRGVTYPRIVYWVRADDHRPHKAEFHALSGRLLKTCLYEGYERLGGEVRPTRLVMTDALKPADESVLLYSGMRARELPDRMFTKDYLKRLE